MEVERCAASVGNVKVDREGQGGESGEGGYSPTYANRCHMQDYHVVGK